MAISAFGEGSDQVKAINDAIALESAGTPVSLTDVKGLRTEFIKASGDFIKMRDAYNKIQSESPTAPGDMSLIYGFMTIVDPGSSVKEGEYATAENAQGIPEKVRTLYNKAIDGHTLGDTTRTAFKAEAGNLMGSQLKSQLHLEDVSPGS